MRVVVTGACGNLGRAVVKLLYDQGFDQCGSGYDCICPGAVGMPMPRTVLAGAADPHVCAMLEESE